MEFRDSFSLTHQLDLRKAKFFSFSEVIARFVCQIQGIRSPFDELDAFRSELPIPVFLDSPRSG